jgi:hypothetical protein
LYIHTHSVPFPGQGPPRPIPLGQSFFVPLPDLSTTPSPPGVSSRAVRVSLSVRVSADPGFGPSQSGRALDGGVRAGAVVRASLGRRQSVSRPGLRVSRYGTGTGHEWPHADDSPVGTVLEPFMRSAHVFGQRATAPWPSPRPRAGGSQARAPSCPVCGPASIFGCLLPAAPFFILLPLYPCSCLISPCS